MSFLAVIDEGATADAATLPEEGRRVVVCPREASLPHERAFDTAARNL